ncbi:Uu.00g096000.m01.CDS01 [Anthostomella pinea]|uniref:Uu.00g096000.m01.CDS01 n=1 Tax=Anthostomella pinea TaxID=933095 RepID=A0AAI8VC72_9PEZI|nr:Uu.00g096000.m01.CDS01 [Anthostomella pinea]
MDDGYASIADSFRNGVTTLVLPSESSKASSKAHARDMQQLAFVLDLLALRSSMDIDFPRGIACALNASKPRIIMTPNQAVAHQTRGVDFAKRTTASRIARSQETVEWEQARKKDTW